MIGKQKLAALAWLWDPLAAALFAFGLASAIAGWLDGQAPKPWHFAALLAGGGLRGLIVMLAHGLAIAGAQEGVAALRGQIYQGLLGGHSAAKGGRQRRMSGETAALAVDHLGAIENYEARFVPAKTAAMAQPFIVAILVAFASPVAAGIMLLTMLPFGLGMALAGMAAKKSSERQLEALAHLSGLFVDRIAHLPLIRHFGAGDRVVRKVRASTRDVADRTVQVLRVAFLSSAILEFFAALSVALVAVYCGFSLLGLLPFPSPEDLSFRAALFALAMTPEFYLPMRRLAAAYHEKQLGEAARKALADAQAPAIGFLQDAAMPSGSDSTQSEGVQFDGVKVDGLSIEYPGRTIGPITLAIGRSGMLAVTGPTGSGKTTLLGAIAGQVVAASGSLTPVAQHDIGWSVQRPLILPGTLRDNLSLANPQADDAAMLWALEQAGLMPALAERKAGLDLWLDHKGSGLSGGERRRIGLARAILSQRALLLLDEPTADLDDNAALAVVASLRSLAARQALIIASHDARLIAACDAEVAL